MNTHHPELNKKIKMKLIRIKIKPCSLFRSPFHSDTLWGSLALLVSYGAMNIKIGDFINLFRSDEPPFILSDGFPGDFLPVPVIYKMKKIKKDDGSEIEYKKLKKLSLVSFDDFKKIINGGDITIENYDKIKDFCKNQRIRNTINRLTEGTMEEGGLYRIREQYLPEGIEYISVYALVKDEWIEKLIYLFWLLGKYGYGADTTSGYGFFDVEEKYENLTVELIEALEKPNSVVHLSHYVPKKEDPFDGFYEIEIKFGRLGGHYAQMGYPFKKPIAYIKPGSVFKTDKPEYFYGRILNNICKYPEVVQFGYSIAIPAKFNLEVL